MPVMQVGVDELMRSDDDDDDDDDTEEKEEEYGRGAATRLRRRKRMLRKEGYSQYLPASLCAVPEPWTVCSRGGTATHNAKKANADYRREPPAPAQPEYASPCRRPTPPPPPPSPPVEPPWATSEYDPPAVESWHADYDRSIRRQSTWSLSSSSATLSAIYDAYTAARNTATTAAATSLCAPSSIFTHRRVAAAAEMPRSGAVSPPSPSVYSPVVQETSQTAAAAAAAASTPRWGACARAMRPPPPLPLQQRRLLSEITAPKRVERAAAAAAAAARPAPLMIVRDPIQSVRLESSKLLLGCGVRQRRQSPTHGDGFS